MVCAYCGEWGELVTGQDIYPHRPDLYEKKFYRCAPCNAYVGCHPGTAEPLGRMANAELRQAKSAAHAAFDPLWKSRKMRRNKAYAWLAERLGVSRENCHIGMFDVDQCRRVVRECKAGQ